ncbi:MAG: hypothetical protein GY718_09995 [Lentisphaerae bacterium]|nr:hypothetical protein [Lentisphaerota bacterium]
MRINLSDKVKFSLTEKGKIVYYKKYGRFPIEDNGFVIWSLWELMYEFGPVMYLGNFDLPIDTWLELV